MSSCFVRLCYRFGPFVSSGQVDERLGRRVGVLDPMRRVGAAAAAVARDEVGRFIAHGDADGAVATCICSTVPEAWAGDGPSTVDGGI
jgi:hypothetical protein